MSLKVRRENSFKWPKEEVKALIFRGRALGMSKASSLFTIWGTDNFPGAEQETCLRGGRTHPWLETLLSSSSWTNCVLLVVHQDT